MVLLDKGPLPNPGGSTGHASNFIFPVDHNKEMALLGVQSANQYRDVERSVDSGGIEVARTQERMDEFNRRMTSAKAWGVEAELLTPAQVKELVPFINDEVILGGFHCPSVSVVDSLDTGTLFRNEAIERAGLRVFANTEVLDVETEDEPATGLQRVTAVVTDKGRIEAEYVVIACGVWSNRIANMAGATIPLVPAVHQMADVGPIDVLAETNNEIGYPIVRDMDTFCYERQSSGSMEVGSYAHRPILHHPDDIPSNDEAALSPTEMPFTADDFDQQMEEAIELMDMLGDAEIKYAINGLLSLTPDAMPCLGETAEVRNLWSAAAVWVKEGPGMAQVVAEWMTYGYPRVIDAHGADIARFYEQERNDEHIWSRAEEHFNKTYGIVHPAEQWEHRRNLQVSPLFSRQEALDAFFFQARTWERPQWYGANADLVERYGSPSARRMGQPLVEPDHRRRAPQPARERRNGRPLGVPDLPAVRAGRRRVRRLPVGQQDRPGRSGDVHAVADSRRWVPLRPDDASCRRGHGERRDRRLRRWPRPRLDQEVHAQGWLGHGHRPHAGDLDARPVGSERAGHAREAHRCRPLVRGIAVRVDRRGAAELWGRRDRCVTVPHLLRRRHRLGDLRRLGRRTEAVGRADGSRCRSRHPADGWRRVRHVGPHREGLPPPGRGAGERVQPARGRSRPSEGQVGRLHRQGGVPRRARGG